MAAGTLVSSGSSLNIPTGSGSERLCRASISTLNADWQEILSGTAGHIYTIISMIFCDQQGASGKIQCKINNGTNDISILSDPTIVGAYGTFVWNDKFVLEEDDDLDVYNQCTDGHWWISYIDQDWT
tara:strand:+ start:587 stop:967 length:381 start_codon:yes stop_codon:yes gene_type:complete